MRRHILEYSTPNIIEKNSVNDNVEMKEYLIKLATDPVGTPDFYAINRRKIKQPKLKDTFANDSEVNTYSNKSDAERQVDEKTKSNKFNLKQQVGD